MAKRTSKRKGQPPEEPVTLADPLVLNEADGIRIGEEPVPGMRLRAICRGHQATIGRITWSPCGRFIASPSSDGFVRIWDAQNGKCLNKLKATEFTSTVAFIRDANVVAFNSDRDGIKILEVQAGRELRQSIGHSQNIVHLLWISQEEYLASAPRIGDPSILIWNIDKDVVVREVGEYTNEVHHIAWCPVTKRLASCQGSRGSDIHIWDGRSWELNNSFECGTYDNVFALAWSPDGSILASCGHRSQHINIWDMKRMKLMERLEGHTSDTTYASFSSDGRLLATRTFNNEVQLRDCNDWSIAATLQLTGANWSIPNLCFHPSRNTLATLGEKDEVICIWEIDPQTLLDQSQAKSNLLRYTSAKIVLVGESNVGKSCLAMRLAEDRYPEDYEQGTTHGMRFWSMEAEELHPKVKPPEGQRRDVVLWDFGGQDEYQLVHQMFLHDTTLALVLIDPTRGKNALDEARDWNKRLEKHLGQDKAVKLLIGAKVDNARQSKHINHTSIDLLCQECGFTAFVDLSARTGRKTKTLRKVIANVLDWEQMAKTTRPELFQHIRDDIERRCKENAIVLTLEEFKVAIKQSVADKYEEAAVDAVTNQLATQGIIARTKLTGGDDALILQLPIIERYAGSLILSARNNPRGVPVLEERLLGSAKGIPLPGITQKERLKRDDERMVLECIVELMIQHGICFRHGGLLVFPTLFPAGRTNGGNLEHSVSLYYDFTGAIDNIYASLVSKLMVSEEFGEGRLDAGRVEFERSEEGICGVRQIKRTGGLAHVDLFFSDETPSDRRDLFTRFVEQHLKDHGVEIQEHQAIKCACGEEIPERIIRLRIAAEEKDVVCPVCERKTLISEGIARIRKRDPASDAKIIALRKRIEKETGKAAARVKAAVANETISRKNNAPIRLLHLSDLHFEVDVSPTASLQWLIEDLRCDNPNFPAINQLEYLVLSGDVTHRGDDAGFDVARQFIEKLLEESNFGLASTRCIFVPGNHDVQRRDSCYRLSSSVSPNDKQRVIKKGDIYLERVEDDYPNRFKKFSDAFYHKIMSSEGYPLAPEQQGMSYHFADTGVQFIALNTAWEIDQFFPSRSSVHPEALANAIKLANQQVDFAVRRGDRKRNQPQLRIAVFHHAVHGPWAMQNLAFISNLQTSGVKLCLHGDVHEMRRQWIDHWEEGCNLHVIGTGTFGSKRDQITDGSARSYNLLEIAHDLKSARVYVREQPRPDGAWQGWNEFPDPDGGRGKVPFFDINFA
ncbi:GTP-binding protein [Acaryochloris sp. IP29b_bin.137]|uniref:WD40 domain-containing protein n=1 Tax=Acaryochloris sp. IP29b_bin.137 TaxID=2969217 RepID=UPI002613613D|nr:GTP-binding protein [Acaryochloris sp. IP29b_bin.137]